MLQQQFNSKMKILSLRMKTKLLLVLGINIKSGNFKMLMKKTVEKNARSVSAVLCTLMLVSKKKMVTPN